MMPSIPILDDTHNIVGWTSVLPTYENGRLVHGEAERLLGGPVRGVLISLHDPEDASRAGAPGLWQGKWDCFALAREGAAHPAPAY